MRVFLLANNRVGLLVTEALAASGDEIVGVVVHEPDQALHRDEILAAAGVLDGAVFAPADLRDPRGLSRVATLGAEIAFSAFYGEILRQPFLDLFPRGVLNLHPSFLPWNRGKHPNVWSIVDGTPAGATIHYVDAGIDSGDIVAQLRVAVEPADTAKTLYARLERACGQLFETAWPSIRDGTGERRLQDPAAGSFHRARDLASLDEIELDAPTTGRALLDRLRARTFEPWPSCWFRADDGRRVFVRVELRTEDDVAADGPASASDA